MAPQIMQGKIATQSAFDLENVTIKRTTYAAKFSILGNSRMA